MILIKLLRALGLVTLADVRRIENSTIPLKTTSVISAAFAFAILIIITVIAGLQLELFSPGTSEIQLPGPQTAPMPREQELDLELLEQKVHEDFRDKVVQLQVELERLQEYQYQIESQLTQKTVEASELDHLADTPSNGAHPKKPRDQHISRARHTPPRLGPQLLSRTDTLRFFL